MGLIIKPVLFVWLAVFLAACSKQQRAEPDLAQIKADIQQRFHQAYDGLAEVSDLELTLAESELNNADHRVYDVKLTAVVTDDLAARLANLPDTMENKIQRGRIKGVMTLGAVHKGQKITARLRALVERDLKTGRWQVVGLIRSTQAQAQTQTKKDGHS